MAPTSAITSPKVTQASVPMRFVGPMKISAQASFDAFTHMLADSNSHIGMDYDTFSDEIASGAREL